MSSLYIGVYKALYDYAAQADEELTLRADDLLYLLEKSDIDDWWKVKKRVVPVGDEEVEEPVGLVPSNYIELAQVIKTASALYDYDKQTEEELSFKEGEHFNIFDLSDPDWLLVGDSTNQLFGFIPSNYIELHNSNAAVNTPIAPQPQQAAFQLPPQSQPQQQPQPSQFIPPPQHPSHQPVDKSPSHQSYNDSSTDPSPQSRGGYDYNDVGDDIDDDAPPPMPSRPTGSGSAPAPSAPRPLQPSTTGNKVGDYEQEEDISAQPEHSFDGEFFTWYIDEVDGRKKRAVIFSIGKGLVIMKPNTSNPKKLKLKSASQLDNEWRIKDIIQFSHEKKHVFLDMKNPDSSIELHAGSKDVAEAIISILGDLKGAERAQGLKEVVTASRAATDSSNRRVGKLLFDFVAQGDDELGCKEGDEVYIVNDTKSKDWWMCENIDTKKQGVVPSSYIEIVGTANLDKLTDGPQRRKSLKSSSKGRVVESSRKHHRSRDERDRIRERDRIQRDKSSSKRSDGDKSMPNYHRVRTWIDSSGSFKVEAEFLGCVEGKIHLHKSNGVKIAVAANKLSIEDLEYVEKITGTSLAQYKDEVLKQNLKKKTGATKSSVAAINDIPLLSHQDLRLQLLCLPVSQNMIGLREGDILRVMKFLDNKFNRKSHAEEVPANTGSLFTESSGALKNNSNSEISKVSAKALPSPSPNKTVEQQSQENKFEDDAWAVKPAARSNEDLSKPSSRPQTPQYTGSLQDLYLRKTDPVNAPPAASVTPSAPALTPVKTGSLVQPGDQFSVQKTGGGLASQTTGNFKPVSAQQTGNLIPAQPTGFAPITAQPTGFMPIQPTGFVPVQATGILQPQITFGIVPLQTGATTFTAQKTGPQSTMPTTSFNQLPMQPTLQTGNVTMPQTSFGSQPTGGNMPQTSFGGQSTGGFMSIQNTASMVPTQRTAKLHLEDNQLVDSLKPHLGQPTGGFPQTSFGQPAQQFPQTSFGGQPTGGFQQPNQFPQNTFGQPAQQFPQTSFGQPAQQFPQTTFGQPQQFPQQGFAQPDMNQMTNMFQNTGISSPNTFGQAQPNTTFGQQPTFDGFNQPLQAQPTGAGFGNAPGSLQPQPTESF
ncbi:hypothetical protein QCA50_013948 [Cerrena zonata]|uniref:SH3 domain-containing protein n=1 Tax=Cerrena zonata TaxID=2478898 RepID=A0AAW0G1I8_9APHY